MKITIIGNSVCLRVRPPREESNKTYSALLEDAYPNGRIINFGLTRMLSSELEKNKDKYIRTFPDYYILNIGCVDAPPREIPKWYSDIIFGRKLECLYPVANLIYLKIIKKYLRKNLVKLRMKKTWVSKVDFGKNIDRFLRLIKKETFAEIIIIGINQGNQRIEAQLPGATKNYEDYNTILKNIAFNNEIKFIDTTVLDSEIHFPDGVHFNETGHNYIAERILEDIEKYESSKIK